jgi:hypothetical protein
MYTKKMIKKILRKEHDKYIKRFQEAAEAFWKTKGKEESEVCIRLAERYCDQAIAIKELEKLF